MAIRALFPTLLYHKALTQADGTRFNRTLLDECQALAASDSAGRKWSAKHYLGGYTSYGSLDRLHLVSSVFARLARALDPHVKTFAQGLKVDLRGGKPLCDSMWVNVLPEGGSHSSHLHTNAVLSGTYYVKTPPGAGPIVFEDPRHVMMMAAPPRKASAPRPFRTYVSTEPAPGALILWESWLRHEVPLNRAQGERISVSFNLVIG